MKMKPSSLRATLARPELVAHDYSRAITKHKPPRIRIIHVIEPEIIETDAENFQELVQRLTGKQVERKGNTAKSSSLFLHHCSKVGIKTEAEDAVKKENEEIYDAENGDGILSFLEELDGFFVDMNELPLLSCRPSQVNTVW